MERALSSCTGPRIDAKGDTNVDHLLALLEGELRLYVSQYVLPYLDVGLNHIEGSYDRFRDQCARPGRDHALSDCRLLLVL